MGLQNFEKDFKKKLLNRKIAPSAESWDKLEAKLEHSGGMKTYRLWWLGIAACIAGAVFMLNQFYFDSVVPVSPPVVEAPVEAEESEEVPGVREIPVVEETLVSAEESKELIKSPGLEKQQPLMVPTAGDAIAAVEKQQQQGFSELRSNKEEASPVEEKAVSAGLEEVAAVSMKEESGTVSNAEIEALLQEAAADIRRERTIRSGLANVDHESLLWEVEMELERSFREKVLDILKEGYMKTRTAVANRSF